LVEQLDLSTPAFDRLYNDMIKKRVRMDELRGRVQKEEGITFYPKTNSVKNKLNPSRSYTSFRQSSKQEKMEESFTKKHSKKDLLMNGENNNHNGLVE
jgi:ASC-1-like (ASCH) protein